MAKKDETVFSPPKMSKVPKPTVAKVGVGKIAAPGVSSRKGGGTFSNAPARGFGKMSKHQQVGPKSGIADHDMQDQLAHQADQPVDPFSALMAAASKNARFSPPQYGLQQGAVDPNDPAEITPDEHANMPKKRKLA